jgi:stringent starvation protein B
MTSNRPYLLRALYEWIIDNGMTPHLLVDAACKDTIVPRKFVEDNRIILNIHPQAVHHLELGNEKIVFSARFNGKPCRISIPVGAVIAIYARENGKGLIFPEEKHGAEMDNLKMPARGQHLKIIK